MTELRQLAVCHLKAHEMVTLIHKLHSSETASYTEGLRSAFSYTQHTTVASLLGEVSLTYEDGKQPWPPEADNWL